MLKLKEASLNWAIKHINKYNDTYIFPRPFEFEAINQNWTEVLDYLKSLNILECGIRPYRSEITPKSQVGFRISTQLDPLDSIIYNAIIYEIFRDIEKARIDKSLNKVYSFRLAPENDGTLYDNNYNWDSFNQQAQEISRSEEYKYVVVTDIADFYPSIYLHNIETVLRECVKESGKSAHAETIINIIKAMHVIQTHKGLPIGPQFSRPIAELILDEIDRILINDEIEFIRYVDDYRIFCKSESEAYRALSFLAQKLYDLRNLKLNEQKTKILAKANFQKNYLRIFKDKENDRRLNEFHELCEKIGISTSSYDDIDIEELDPVDKEALEQLNIFELLAKELNEDAPDLGFAKFLLNNLAKFDNTDVAELILNEVNIRKVFPILRSFIGYLERVRSFSEEQKYKIGKLILDLFDDSFITELKFNRAWLINLFTVNEEWNNKEQFLVLYRKYDDNTTRRELLLSLGRSKNQSFYRENKMANLANYDHWLCRAFIAGISCLPEDERRPWYKSRGYMQRDFLDKIIEKWAIKKPF
jgi:hypothetical protein